MDLELAPGRYPLPLSDRWTLVALVPVSGVVVLGLFLDGELVELVDDPLDVLGYLRASALMSELGPVALDGGEGAAIWCKSDPRSRRESPRKQAGSRTRRGVEKTRARQGC